MTIDNYERKIVNYILQKRLYEGICKHSDLTSHFVKDIGYKKYDDTKLMNRKMLESKIRDLLRLKLIIPHEKRRISNPQRRRIKGNDPVYRDDNFTVNWEKFDDLCPEFLQKSYEYAIQHKIWFNIVLGKLVDFSSPNFIDKLCDYGFHIELLEDFLKYVYNNIEEFNNTELKLIGICLLYHRILNKQALKSYSNELKKAKFGKTIEEILNYGPELINETLNLISEKLKEHGIGFFNVLSE